MFYPIKSQCPHEKHFGGVDATSEAQLSETMNNEDDWLIEEAEKVPEIPDKPAVNPKKLGPGGDYFELELRDGDFASEKHPYIISR